jgi:cyclic beta-1,2-glucan synthetase
MGHGDWNDGMNRVGAGGAGESVWLAWFALSSLQQFANLAEARGDMERASAFRVRAKELGVAAETSAWDGRWYRRAYFDNGAPLGSEQNDECRIDSIAQTWAILCGRADDQRSQSAMDAVEEFLVDREGKLILLFSPPFDAGTLDPGYVKGYLPGIRENGGQYTHAAAWVIRAMAELGYGGRAFELLNLINPIKHTDNLPGAERYKVEPYVIAGDAYSRAPHIGRGGWTWYTGSASWIYQTIIESILGFKRRGNDLSIEPHLPPDWRSCEIRYQFGSTAYRITVGNPDGLETNFTNLWLDGQLQTDPIIRLVDDGLAHEIRVEVTRK